ncbi:MAG TPA: hypothetical protein VM487_11280 [Phycisphaerae bacterium]|nr:hypothetical protein [Phycisphaerae bacterium]
MTWAITARELLYLPTVSPISARRYRGRYPDPALEGTIDLYPVDSNEPHERSADGCPGGWYRTPYVDSVAPYLRRRTEGGGRVENPLFTTAPMQVQAAVMHYEAEQERWHAHKAEVTHQRWEKAHS